MGSMTPTDDGMRVLLVRTWFEAGPSEPSLRIRVLELARDSGPGGDTLAVATSVSEACEVVCHWLGQLENPLKGGAARG
jgi:hypothetical protein